jgi:hypothetical protein
MDTSSMEVHLLPHLELFPVTRIDERESIPVNDVKSKKSEAGENRTPNLRVWNPTRCHCATAPSVTKIVILNPTFQPLDEAPNRNEDKGEGKRMKKVTGIDTRSINLCNRNGIPAGGPPR